MHNDLIVDLQKIFRKKLALFWSIFVHHDKSSAQQARFTRLQDHSNSFIFQQRNLNFTCESRSCLGSCTIKKSQDIAQHIEPDCKKIPSNFCVKARMA